MSIDKLPRIAAALRGTLEICQVHDKQDSSKLCVQAWINDANGYTTIEGDCCETVQAALESLLAKFEEIGR